MSSPCLDALQLDELAAGRLAGEAARPLRSHMEACQGCRERFEECRRNLDYLEEMGDAFRAQSLAGRSMAAVPSALLDVHAATSPAEGIPGYQIIREIHRGGQGVVYEAVQLSTRRTVALKTLLEGRRADERARWRFEREVKLIASLRHPNIVVIHDSGITAGHYYFAMDYVRGQPLDTHVRLAQPALPALIRLFKQIGDAIAYAHRRGVIHRDLKPSNILVHEQGTPYVLDFGLAKMTGDDLQETRAGAVSLAGHLMGTIRYMSPEQTLGDPDALDIRTDVFSLGVILYELVTGSSPYSTSADLAACFTSIREQEPPRPSRRRRDVNSDLETIILKAMAKEPERRYQSAGELTDDLNAWLEGRPIAAKSTSSFYVIRKLAVRHSFESLAILSIVAAIVGFAAITLHYYRQAAQDADRLRTTQAHLVRLNQSLTTERDEIRAALPGQALGWFLAEWEAGHLERAREVQRDIPPQAPEFAVMSYLLADAPDPRELRARVGATHPALVEFALGERALRQGQPIAAMNAFRACLAAPGSAWIRSAAQTRLDALAQRTAQATTRAAP